MQSITASTLPAAIGSSGYLVQKRGETACGMSYAVPLTHKAETMIQQPSPRTGRGGGGDSLRG